MSAVPKYLIRIKMKGSDIVFDPEYAPGILTVAHIVLEREPESLDEVMQKVKMEILHHMFDVEFIEDDSDALPEMKPASAMASPYLQ